MNGHGWSADEIAFPRRLVAAGWTDALRHFVQTLPRTLDEVETLLTHNNLWVGRNRDVGAMSAEEVARWTAADKR